MVEDINELTTNFSIRLKLRDLSRLLEAAEKRGKKYSVLARECLLYGLEHFTSH